MKPRLQRTAAILLGVLTFVGYVSAPNFFQKTHSANLTNVSNTLSSSRFSFIGQLAATGNSVGSSIIRIVTDPTAVGSTSSSQLATPSGSTSTVKINATNYDLGSIMPGGDESIFTISDVGGLLDTSSSNFNIIATQSATHTIRFTTANAVPEGAIRVLIPATLSPTHGDDGIPDRDGFDLGETLPAVTCPTDVPTYYDFVAGTATASNFVSGSGQRFHTIECKYSGPGNPGQSFQNNPIRVTSVINPGPTVGHQVGTADTYNMTVQNLIPTGVFGVDPVDYDAIDETSIQIGVIESVRVSLRVAPQITFRIGGIPFGETEACGGGNATNVTTTPTQVPFGAVTINTFRHAAQSLHVATNAASGYSVTAQQNDNLGLGGQACPDGSFPATCIPDVTAGSATYAAEGDWTVTTEYGFGFTLEEIGGSVNLTTPFTRTSGSGCSTFCARQFADLENSEPATTIFSSTSVSDVDNVQVCYRVNVSALQPAGDYENHVIYTATANF